MADRYQGDRALADLLEEAGVRMTPAEVRSLVEGVVSAMVGRQSDAWIELVTPDPGPALRRQLIALKDQVAAERTGARDASPVPTERLRALRDELERLDLQGFLVPRGDAYQSEYVPVRADRLRWLTGFSGSAGLAIVLDARAAIFVDGRYTLQVRRQVDQERFEALDLATDPPASWIAAHLPAGGRIGFDPWLHTERQIETYQQGVARAKGVLVPVSENPIDAVWQGQPAPPIAPVVPHDLRYAGVAAAEKRATVGAALAASGVGAAVVMAPDSIAWLLNLRGGDVPLTPLPLSWAIVRSDGTVDLFIDPRKLTDATHRHLGNGVAVRLPETFGDALEELGRAKATVQVDPGSGPVLERELGVPFAVTSRLAAAGAIVVRGLDPCALPKAAKNAVEVQGARVAHQRDGAAMVRFLAWLAENAPSGRLTELDAAARIEAFRRDEELFVEPSFGTISAAGPHSALPHYRPTPTTNRRIQPGELYLCDSGGQYLDGTTDVTRTIAVGIPTAAMKDRFTRVLRALIALTTARFPEGTRGGHLDGLARRPLWDAGLDFGHGTGHGVGSYLNVHEGPHSISTAPTSAPFQAGVIMSNEPGYYLEGAFGVRIENLIVTVPAAAAPETGRAFLTFETLTAVPIDLTLVEPSLLSPDERAWLDDYHRWVRTTISPLIEGAAADWLARATRPIASAT